MTQRMHTVVLFCFFVLTVALAENEQGFTQRQGDEYKMLQMKEILRRADVDIYFLGKVVDQDGIPVEGANVEIQVTHFSPDMKKLFGQTKTIFKKTDSAGIFLIENEKGRETYIKSILKPGYGGALLTDQNRSFQYAEHGDQRPFVADKNAPVVFSMRKQGRPTFCMEVKYWECQIFVSESGKTKGYDFIHQQQIRDLTKPVFNGETLTCDLQVKATFSTTGLSWTVTLSPGNTNGGIIVTDQLFHEAPDAGYQPEYVFIAEDRRPMKAKYIYLMSRKSSIYSRLELDSCNAADNFFRLNGDSAITNPYGDRNLEPSSDLPYEVTKQLTDEVKATFQQNKRPEKPDIPKRVKEAKENAN